MAWSIFVCLTAAGSPSSAAETALTLAAGEAQAQLAAWEERIGRAMEKVKSAVVRISWKENGKPLSRSGVIVSAEGHVVTQGQERPAQGASVDIHLADGRRVPGTMLGWCATWHIGMMKLAEPGPWPHATLGKLDHCKPSEVCLMLGYGELPCSGGAPQYDPQPVVRVGCVAGVAAPRWVATSCHTTWPDRGSGLFDLEGRLIGIHATVWRGNAIYAGLELVEKHWADLASGKEVSLALAGPGKPDTRKARAPEPKVPLSTDQRAEAARRKARPATVWFRPGCSGVIVTADGYIATCAHHELLPGQEVTVFLSDGRTASAKVLGSDPLCDVGLLKLTEEDHWPYVELGDSRAMKAEDPCLHLGYPAGSRIRRAQPWTRVSRIVEPPARERIFDPARVIYTPGPLFPGDSGGGVFDLDGRLIAIHQGGTADGTLNFSGRIETLQEQWEVLAAGKPAEFLPFVGLGPIAKAFRRALAAQGAFVVEVSDSEKRLALGTVVGASGWILTKASQLEGELFCRTSDGRRLPARVHRASRAHDLALLRVEAEGLTVAPWSTDATVAGMLVGAVGLQDPPVAGVVSRAAHRVPPEPGALVIGQLKESSGGLEILDDSHARKIRLPVVRGDVIVHVEGLPVTNLKSLLALTDSPGAAPFFAVAGDRIRVGLRRGGKLREVSLRLPSHSGAPVGRWSGFESVFQTDIALPATACGCPIVDRTGRVVGVAIASAAQGRVYVIPSPVVRKVVDELQRPFP